MNLHHLRDFFLERLDAPALRGFIAAETRLFAQRMESGEGCISVYGSNDDFAFTLRPSHLKLLCHGYLAGHLTNWDLYYLCDLLTLSRSFRAETASIEEALFVLANPITNRPVSTEAARRVFFWLDEPQDMSLGQTLEPYTVGV